MNIYLKNLGELDPASSLGAQWEELVITNPNSGFMQSSYWARFKRSMGFTVLHMGLFMDNKLVGGSVFYAAPNCKGAGFLAAPDGPVLPWDNCRLATQGLELLREHVEAIAEELGIMALRIAPRLSKPKPDLLQGFAAAPLDLTEKKTIYLDLSPEPEELLNQMKPKGRYNIRLAQRKQVTIREENTPSAAREFYSVMQTVSLRDGFSIEPFSFFITLLDSLCPSGMLKVFFAEHEDDVLGALLMLSFGERSTYLYGGTTNVKRNFMGGYLLQWAAINAAKNSGARIYDFWGYDGNAAPESSYAGFSRFKRQFNGEAIDLVGTLDFYFISQLAGAVIRAMNELQPAMLCRDGN